MTDSLTNEYHAALIKVIDIARNGTRNTAAWQDVLEVATAAIEHGGADRIGKRATRNGWRHTPEGWGDTQETGPSVSPAGHSFSAGQSLER